ncbi:MAG: ABC transporter substrate-binding protein [Muribaculaceae bacterium]|nr:ABC transporter substrate-binding protein [Muribaculaceae bacterium]
MKKIIQLLIIAGITLASACCNSHSANHESDANDTVITNAQLLFIEETPEFTLVRITDPWHDNAVLHTYVLVPSDSVLPGDLPEGTVIRTPLRRAIVYSSVHTSLMKELGAFNALKGVTDLQFFTDSAVIAGTKSGVITDCGSSMNPNVEKVIETEPDAIMLSPYQDATYGQITKLNIPIVECADYMETTPLGRAEWIKFYGILFNKEKEANEIYDNVVKNYNRLKKEAQQAAIAPKVLTETVISNVWNVPGGNSYMAQIIRDAGGKYPWSADTHTGSLSLDFNQVLAEAQDADVWLIKSFNIHTYDDLRGAYPLNAEFKAFKERKIFACDTNESRLFEEFPFHPERLLSDYQLIFRGQTEGLNFFKPLK